MVWSAGLVSVRLVEEGFRHLEHELWFESQRHEVRLNRWSNEWIAPKARSENNVG